MGKSEQAINDSKLIEIIKNENSTGREKQSAFNELFSSHERQLKFFFMKALSGNVNNIEDAADLTMVTFEKVHKNLRRFNPDKGVFSTWLYKIAHNSFIDYVRKDNFEVLSIDRLSDKTSEDNGGMDFQLPSDGNTPEQEMISGQNARLVRIAIDSIDNDFIKYVMKCRYIDELSFEETAEKLNIDNNSTLRVSVHRGIEMMRKKLSSQF